jgi:hypothetical protein
LWSRQLDSKIAAEDVGVGTILELEPDISGRGGGVSARSTELRPRLNVLCRTLWSLQLDSKIPAEVEWVQFWNLSQTSLAEVVEELRREAQSFEQG